MTMSLISILVTYIILVLVLVLVGLVVQKENSVFGHAQNKRGNTDFAVCAA